MLLCNTTTLSIRREKNSWLVALRTFSTRRERERERDGLEAMFFIPPSSPVLIHPLSIYLLLHVLLLETPGPKAFHSCVASVRQCGRHSLRLPYYLNFSFLLFFSLSLCLSLQRHTHTQTDRHSIEKLKKAIPFFLVRVTLRVVLIEFSSVFSFRHLNSSHCHTFVEIFRPFGHTCGSLVHQVIETLDSTSIWENGIKNRIFA